MTYPPPPTTTATLTHTYPSSHTHTQQQQGRDEGRRDRSTTQPMTIKRGKEMKEEKKRKGWGVSFVSQGRRWSMPDVQQSKGNS